MFECILVPLDRSPRAEQALPVAARLARASHGTILLVHVACPPTRLMFVPPNDSQLAQQINDGELEDARDYLEHVQEMNSLSDVQTETVVMAGEAASMLLSIAQTTASDLIVMCRHGQGRFVHWPLGSVTSNIAYQSPIPALILHEGEGLLAGSHSSTGRALRILAPLDGSELAQAALEPAVRILQALSTPERGLLHLTQVVAPSQEEQKKGTISQQAKEYLYAIAMHLCETYDTTAGIAPHPSISWSVTQADDPASGILKVAEASENTKGTGMTDGSDLIVMTTRGYSGLRQWVMGSVTERVLHTLRLPLLIIPLSGKEMISPKPSH